MTPQTWAVCCTPEMRDTVEYLGYVLTPDGLRMAEDKVKTILEWPKPWKIKDVQSF